MYKMSFKQILQSLKLKENSKALVATIKLTKEILTTTKIQSETTYGKAINGFVDKYSKPDAIDTLFTSNTQATNAQKGTAKTAVENAINNVEKKNNAENPLETSPKIVKEDVIALATIVSELINDEDMTNEDKIFEEVKDVVMRSKRKTVQELANEEAQSFTSNIVDRRKVRAQRRAEAAQIAVALQLEKERKKGAKNENEKLLSNIMALFGNTTMNDEMNVDEESCASKRQRCNKNPFCLSHAML